MEKSKVWLCLIILLGKFGGIQSPDPCSSMTEDKEGIFSKEDQFTHDQYLWAPKPSNHHSASDIVDPSKRLIMYLRDVTFASGPTYNTLTSDALSFSGNRTSYATILNNGAENVTADEEFVWYMNLKPNDPVSGAGVILEYSDCSAPLRLEQAGTDLIVTVGDNRGISHSLTAKDILETLGWTTVVVTYKVTEVYLKISKFTDEFSYTETELPICEVDIDRRINATGQVRIGGSYDANLPSYSGRVSCLQFFKGYFLKNYEHANPYCNPNETQDIDLVTHEITQDEDPDNLIPSPSCWEVLATTDSVTTELLTTMEMTTSSATTEPPTTEPRTIEPPTTEQRTTEPPTTELRTTEPPTTEPRTTEPPTTEPRTTEPPTTEPRTTEPPTTEQMTTEPPITEPRTTEPPTTEPWTTEPPTTEPRTTEPPTTEPRTTEPPTTEPRTTEPPTTEPRTTEPSTEKYSTEPPTTESLTGTPEILTAAPFLEVQDSCHTYTRIDTDVAFSATSQLIDSFAAGNLGSCALTCSNTSGCMAIGYDGVWCHLATTTDHIVNHVSGYDIFTIN